MLAAMDELGMTSTASTPAPVFIAMFNRQYLTRYQSAARQLRAAGIGAEVYPDDRNIGKQLKYADRRGFRVAIIAGDDEIEADTWQIKGLADGSQREAHSEQLIETVQELLASEMDSAGKGTM